MCVSISHQYFSLITSFADAQTCRPAATGKPLSVPPPSAFSRTRCNRRREDVTFLSVFSYNNLQISDQFSIQRNITEISHTCECILSIFAALLCMFRGIWNVWHLIFK